MAKRVEQQAPERFKTQGTPRERVNEIKQEVRLMSSREKRKDPENEKIVLRHLFY